MTTVETVVLRDIAIIGSGRLGTALAAALAHAGVTVSGPFQRDEAVTAPIVLLAVPERTIASVAATLPTGTLVGHCSASAPLDTMAPHERFNCHPLMTLNSAGTQRIATACSIPFHNPFHGAACATDGNTEHARAIAGAVAAILGMRAVHVPASQRALYHAAASMASNYLVTLESVAEAIAAETGITRAELAPLARAALEAWIVGGFHGAISGPVSRGDSGVVNAQRDAIALAKPELLPLFDALTNQTRACM